MLPETAGDRPDCPGCPLVLASGSPRRRELLAEAGYRFIIDTAKVEECQDAALSPAELTCGNARLKAGAVALRYPDAVVLGADTMVYFQGELFGKPQDHAVAAAMLFRLQGQTHEVFTGVSLIRAGTGLDVVFHEVSRVTFRHLSPGMIRSYHSRIDPLDKAGAYAAQDHGTDVIKSVQGSWTNVVGLPMETLATRLRRYLNNG